MAEVLEQAGPGTGMRRAKKLSTKVDLTPMVDLGFLLITFFILTTSMSESKAMHLYLPAGENEGSNVGESSALTVIPISDTKTFYYHGKFSDAVTNGLFGTIEFSNNGMRTLINYKKQQLRLSGKYKAEDLVLIIKPADESTLRSLVTILDEVMINDVKTYAMVELSPTERTWMKEKKILDDR